MTPFLLLSVACCGMLVAGIAATATKVLENYSRRELEQYCQRRNRLDLFGEILDDDENVLVAAQSMQIIGLVVAVLSTAPWYCLPVIQSSASLAWLSFAAGLTLTILLAVTVMVWFPSAVARLWAAPFLYRNWGMLRLTTGALRPLTHGVGIVDRLLRRLADRPETEADNEEAFEEEIRSIVTEGLHEGLLEEDAREMIEGVMELGDTDVSDIMTPRSNVDACDVDLSWPEVMEFVVSAGRTRIPVYERSLDTVIGVLYVKDLLRELSIGVREPKSRLRELIHPPWFVPTTKPLDEMLHEFQQTRNHLAIVVDEYRAVAGVVTIEDVLEEIVGEIEDESDKAQDAEITSLDAQTAEVRGTAHIDTVNHSLGLELPEPDECDTIAGLVVRQLGRIPSTGESIAIDGAQITVVNASKRRVETVRIKVVPRVLN